jgi:GTP cyclohydrolase II
MTDRHTTPPDNAVAASAAAATTPSTTAPTELVATRVDRAQTELRHGRAVQLATGDAAACVVVAVEGLTAERLRWLVSLGAPVQLLLTAERAGALGLLPSPPDATAAPMLRTLPAGVALDTVLDWAGVAPASGSAAAALRRLPTAHGGERDDGERDDGDRGQVLHAALALAKRARLTPALLLVRPTAGALPQIDAAHLLSVDCAEVQQMQQHAAFGLRRVSDAQVPIAAHADCTLVVFREDHGGAEHVAVVVGAPDFSQPVPVRLHSSCLTGDLLGSLRCDCGDQLRRAVDQLADRGGVLLYLEQEGRSIGLANKLRAYRLQDDGLDTIDADRSLGFMADERDYRAAVAMLGALGIARIRLLTNNPKKIAAMEAGGIEVVERRALHGPVNAHNARYIETKQARAGHYKD